MRAIPIVSLLAVGAIALGYSVFHSTRALRANDRIGDTTVLPNGWKITPAGEAIPLGGDMPSKIAHLPGGKTAVVVTSGFNKQGLTVVDLTNNTVLRTSDLKKAWCGIAVGDDKVFVSGGTEGVYTMPITDGQLGYKTADGVADLPKDAWIAGLAYGDGKLYALDINHDSLLVLSGTPLAVQQTVKVGYRPFAIAYLPDCKQLAIANWGDQSVSIVDAASMAVVDKIKVGSHPNDLIYREGRLYVSNAGSNSVSVIEGNRVVETVRTSLSPRDPIGSTPVSIDLSPDGSRLFVANADNNDVCVIQVGKSKPSKVLGFIPTGWYPSLVSVTPDGKSVLIGTAKGLKFGPNAKPGTVAASNGRVPYTYIGSMLTGNLNVVSMPSQSELDSYSKQVVMNTPGKAEKIDVPGPVAGALKKIKHVVFVIRENRTYDQVFGDDSRGNGDPNLVMFGGQITPNAHKLAHDFVLLDNIYCNGEVSEDGHQWCNAAYATDFNEKAWIGSYSERGEPGGDDRVTDSPAGYFWDNCKRHGLSYMSYGEFADFTSSPTTAPVFSGTKSLEGHASAAWSSLKDNGGYGRDSTKIDVFIGDLKKAEASGNWPSYMVMSLGEDHTNGLAAGQFTPHAAVASNDLALGKMVDAISHSKFWKDTAIFVIEDDAQNGPDHVDAHRTAALFISPYTKRGVVDDSFYTTSSMIHTMELILGLPPMTQYDAGAAPMVNSVSVTPDFTAYDALPEAVDLNARNPNNTLLARMSAHLDFSAYDHADPDILNYTLWHALKGEKPLPPPVYGAFARG